MYEGKTCLDWHRRIIRARKAWWVRNDGRYDENEREKQIPHRRSRQLLCPLAAGNRATGFGMTSHRQECLCHKQGTIYRAPTREEPALRPSG